MSASLVGSEMCIRDRASPFVAPRRPQGTRRARPGAQVTRRDYVVVSPAAACRVLAFTVTPCASAAARSALSFALRKGRAPRAISQ
eukprot:770320-Alexandrium_andersonii.AAC.1